MSDDETRQRFEGWLARQTPDLEQEDQRKALDVPLMEFHHNGLTREQFERAQAQLKALVDGAAERGEAFLIPPSAGTRLWIAPAGTLEPPPTGDPGPDWIEIERLIHEGAFAAAAGFQQVGEQIRLMEVSLVPAAQQMGDAIARAFATGIRPDISISTVERTKPFQMMRRKLRAAITRGWSPKHAPRRGHTPG